MAKTSERVLIHVENFKGLKNADISLGKFNMLIGANGAGKTSVLEIFKFIQLCTAHDGASKHPFAPWWGFKNIVWAHDEQLPIVVDITYSVAEHKIEYRAAVTGIGGSLEFQEERLGISGYLKINRNIGNVEYTLSETFTDTNKDVLSTVKRDYESKMHDVLTKNMAIHLPGSRSILDLYHGARKLSQNLDLVFLHYHADDETNTPTSLFVPSPRSVDNIEMPIYFIATTLLNDGLEDNLIILRGLDYQTLHSPAQTSNSASLRENGDGLINILFRWDIEHRWPRRINDALEELFPNWRISFTLTDDGRILMKVHNGDIDLNPPSIPDGFYKLLAVLVAVELKPKFLLIDELETSLHGKMIEYILGELKTCSSRVVVSTHSPAVIDMVDLEDISMLEQSDGKTSCTRIDDPETLRNTLRERGLTMSDWWMYE